MRVASIAVHSPVSSAPKFSSPPFSPSLIHRTHASLSVLIVLYFLLSSSSGKTLQVGLLIFKLHCVILEVFFPTFFFVAVSAGVYTDQFR